MKRLFLLAMVVLTMGTAFAQSVTVMTVKMKDGAEVPFYADSVKKVTMPENEMSDSKFIDLGLPSRLLWATCNVGANKPWEYGDYYSFRAREVYRLPTKAEMQELIDSCTWEVVPDYAGVLFRKGWVGTSKYNGRQIFFPAAGSHDYLTYSAVGDRGYYWSGSLRADYSRHAYYMEFSGPVPKIQDIDYGYEYSICYSVRLVCPAAK